jgi:hypothetical protein
MRVRRPVVHFDTVLACASDDLTRVELEGCDWEFVPVSFGDSPCAYIPDLESARTLSHIAPYTVITSREMWTSDRYDVGCPLTRIVLSRLPVMILFSSNWRHVTGAVCPDRVR